MIVLSALAWAIAGCGGGGGGPAPGGECTASADTCTGERICVAGACEAAFSRIYSLMDVTVSVPSTDSTGSAWDALGGAPDPFIVVVVNGAVVSTSATRDDSFSTSAAGPFDFSLIAGSSLGIEVWDEDVSANDLMFTCEASPITATLLRGRELSCVGDGFSVSFQIDPR